MELILEGISMSVLRHHAARGGRRITLPRCHQSRWEPGAPSSGMEIVNITLADATAVKASIAASINDPFVSRDHKEAIREILACLESMQLALEVENALAAVPHKNASTVRS